MCGVKAMSDKKPVSWGSSFDHVVFWGLRTGARRLQADREAKFENKYGRDRPHEQQPQHPGGAGALNAGKDGATGGENSPPVELVEDDASLQREEHDETVELLQDVAQELENQQLDQQQQDLELPVDNNQHSDEGGSSGNRTPPGSPLASPPRVESDDEDMASTKIGIPKFTGQETDVSDKDWFTGLQTYFTEKSIGAGEWERRCGLIRWSLVSDSIPDGQDSTSASSWFKGIMEDDGPGGRVFTSFADFRDKFEKRWITGTPLQEASNIFRRLTQNQKETIREYAGRIMREDGRLMRLGMSMMTVEAADRQGWRQAFEWLNIIVLMGGLRDEFLNHVKRAVTQLPAADRTWEQIKETASIQQDHESNRRTRSSSFSKGNINYTGQRGRSNSPCTRGAGGGGGSGGGNGPSGGGGKKKQHWREYPLMRPSWVGPRHMTQDACMVCNFTGHKAGQCKTAKNKQNWGGWPATEPSVWPQPGGSAQNARAPPQQQSQQQSQQPAQATGGVAAVSAHCAGYQPSSWLNFV